MKKLIVVFIGLCALSSVSAQKIGEKVYKELSINGESVGKWCEYISLDEFDESGRKTHTKGAFTDTTFSYDENGKLVSDSAGDVYKYDSHGNNIYFKNPSRGFEIYYEYDSNGNMIHYSRTDGVEEWNEYGKNNNRIHQRTSIGNDLYLEYDKNGNKSHEKWFMDGKTLRSEITWSYNSQNKATYRKEIKYENGKIGTTSEDFFKYDSKGNLSQETNIYTTKYGKWNTEQRYAYDSNGNLLYNFYEKGDFSSVDFHELEYWDEAKTKIKSDKLFRYTK